MTSTVSTPLPTHQEGTPRNATLYRRGLALAVVGLCGFAPSLLTAALSDEWRGWGAASTLGFWVIWKIGRTIMKVNSGLA